MKRFTSMAAKAALALGLTAFFLTSTQLASAQTPGMSDETVVLKVGDENVTLADFEHVFRKNNKDSVTTTEALDAYMELFVNFKLKVLEAEAMGMDTVSAFKKELAGYRDQLARPYMVDSDLLDASFERHSTADAFRHQFLQVVFCVLEVAVFGSFLHGLHRAHAAVRFESATLVDDGLAGALFGSSEHGPNHDGMTAPCQGLDNVAGVANASVGDDGNAGAF